jgi:hypothetical protein
MAEVVAQLRAVLDEATHARTRAAGAVAAATLSRDRLAGLARGGSHPLLSRAVGKLTVAVARLREADQLAADAATAVVDYARIIGVELPAPPQASSVVGRPAAPVGTRWGLVRDAPQHVRDAGRGFLARPEGVSRPTAGAYQGERIESGGKDKRIAEDLDYDPLRGPPVTFYQHVESKAAARIRRDRIADADVVLDNTVCGTNQHDQDHAWACEKILPSILPPGARLTVWVTRDSGQTWWRGSYLGTGERIKR